MHCHGPQSTLISNPKLRGRSISLVCWRWMCGLITLASCCLLPKQGDWGTANSVWSGLAEWIIVGFVGNLPGPPPSRPGWEISWLGQKMCQSGGISSYVVSSDEEERHLQLWCDVVSVLTNKMPVYYSARKINCYSSSLWAKFFLVDHHNQKGLSPKMSLHQTLVA